jgi:hypothetical protein
VPGDVPIKPVDYPRIPTAEAKKNGPLLRWVARLHDPARPLGEDPNDARTWVRDSLWADACAEALAIQRRTGYGIQTDPPNKPQPGRNRMFRIDN